MGSFKIAWYLGIRDSSCSRSSISVVPGGIVIAGTSAIPRVAGRSTNDSTGRNAGGVAGDTGLTGAGSGPRAGATATVCPGAATRAAGRRFSPI